MIPQLNTGKIIERCHFSWQIGQNIDVTRRIFKYKTTTYKYLRKILLSGLNGRGLWLKSFQLDISSSSVCGIFSSGFPGSSSDCRRDHSWRWPTQMAAKRRVEMILTIEHDYENRVLHNVDRESLSHFVSKSFNVNIRF